MIHKTEHIHRIKYDGRVRKPAKSRQTRMEQGLRLKIMLADLGLTPESAGKILHVAPRTVRYWISGKTQAPYAAYRLLRIMTGAEPDRAAAALSLCAAVHRRPRPAQR